MKTSGVGARKGSHSIVTLLTWMYWSEDSSFPRRDISDIFRCFSRSGDVFYGSKHTISMPLVQSLSPATQREQSSWPQEFNSSLIPTEK